MTDLANPAATSSTHPSSSSSSRSEDVLFRSPTIVSGSEHSEPYVADVLISNGLISKIAPSISAPHARQVNAEGCILCPGFIDMHAHSDLYLLTHPDHEPKISQGCTTEVVGQDGISYVPIRDAKQMNAVRKQIAGWNGNPSDEECAAGGSLDGVGMFQWHTMGDYLDCLDRNRTATNVAMLVPQGNLRLLACGPYDTPASEEEIRDQVELLREAMSDGAVGMSSGLTYTPGMYASNSELAVLCQTLADEYPGAYYAPHHRSYGHRAIESYGEMLDLANDTGCPVHLTHATLNFPENKGRAPELISMIDHSRSSGADISLDTYPYLPGCTTLASLLPSWASAGGPEETLKRLEDPATREKIRYAIEVTGCDGGHGIPTDWNVIQLGTCDHPSIQRFSGERVGHVAAKLDIPAIQLFFDVLQKDRLATTCIMHIGNEENVRMMMCHETHCAGSDAILHGSTLHPRAYGTFPRFLSHYARDLHLTSLPEMISHLTCRPAKRLGIYPHRGCIQESSAGDIVLFDPKTIRDTSTHENPRSKAEGVRWVLVNGKVAVEEGKLTGARAGVTLRRGKDGKVRGRGESMGTNGVNGACGVNGQGKVNGTANGHVHGNGNGHVANGANGVNGANPC